MKDEIFIKGAKENNLKNIDLRIPRNKLVVFTGISGSGKTSLAFDTIFAEGQRRYVESLSSYARQFLGQMDKPDVELIEGLSPAISIDQRSTSHNPRSTVGTVTEVYDYLRLLYARIGVVHCPECGREIEKQGVDQICDRVMALPEGSKILVNAPVARGKKGEFSKALESFAKNGYVRVKIDGAIYSLEEEIKLDKNVKHNISVVVDRLVIKPDIGKRLTDSIETAIKLSEGLVVIDCDGTETLYSDKYACPDCNISIEEVEPRLFSFNSPFGACPDCMGLGFKSEIDPELIIKDRSLSLNQGAMAISGWNMDFGSMNQMYFKALSKEYGFSLDTPVKDLPEKIVNILLYGSKGIKFDMSYNSSTFSGSYSASWEGLVNNLSRRYRETTSDFTKAEIERYMKVSDCQACGGLRLKKEALAVTVDGKNIAKISGLSISDLYQFFQTVKLSERDAYIARQILQEIWSRLNFLINVGLNYLTLARSAGSLSGGEAQRIRLATQIGSGLTGVLYILDEPSIGLHQRDNARLLNSLKSLRDLGNTLIVVEHDEETMRECDHLVDIGPGAGAHGGEVVAQGTVEDVINTPRSVTGQYLSGKRFIAVPEKRRPLTGHFLKILGARENNLKNIDVEIPLGLMTAVTGVSGSGKSSLINMTLRPHLAALLNRARVRGSKVRGIEGAEQLDKIIDIDQSPIGRTPRSNPATYTGAFTHIRELFASTADAKERGYGSGRFSFNVKGGRCEACGGDGIKRIEMNFLPDVYVQCEACKGKRYNRETLQVKYKGKNISEVLEMTVEEAVTFFGNYTSIRNKIQTLFEVGLGYIKLGQAATTLSGGEAQRVKLATELSKRGTGRTVYILDEPTTGLHIADIDKLISILQRLTDGGNTVIVIEHNLDVIKVCDYIIDMGPEGGEAGGYCIASGTPEEVALVPESFTGRYLKKMLKKN
ncbi:MAG: excinuclease ABC subunit UvrA [Clostridiales bacterium]|jgi:excinuclease ABC subunit A|nr:excinuclease ABC subunit UvrA [Clostridiales bacterium]